MRSQAMAQGGSWSQSGITRAELAAFSISVLHFLLIRTTPILPGMGLSPAGTRQAPAVLEGQGRPYNVTVVNVLE